MHGLDGLEPSSLESKLDSKGGLDEPLLEEMFSSPNAIANAGKTQNNSIVLTKFSPPGRFDEPKINFDPIHVFDPRQDRGIFGIQH